jgi:hypothetical protein
MQAPLDMRQQEQHKRSNAVGKEGCASSYTVANREHF